MRVIRWAVLATVMFGTATLAAEFNRDLTADRLRADLMFLASDECEGRGPGTAGIDKAAAHIAASFQASGLKPAGKDDSWFQPFNIRGSAKPVKAEMVLRGPKGFQLTLADDGFSPLGMSGTGKVAKDLVFIGHGIKSTKVPYDDFEGLNVEGKIAVMLRRSPRYGGAKKFADDETLQTVVALTRKVENAEKAKAAAVIMVNDKTTVAESGDLLAPFASFAFGSPAKIPAVQLRRDLAEILFQQAFGKSLEQLEEEIDRDGKPKNGDFKDWSANLDVTIDRDRRIDVKNVVGTLEGYGPLADEIVVIGAHYDHLGYGGRGSLQREAKQLIHYGADDNASGTTTLLELARRLGADKSRQGRRLVFIAFSAEEVGLLGSAHYCKEPLFSLEKTVAMLNLDMTGRLALDKDTKKDKIEIGGTGTGKPFDAMIDKFNEQYKFQIKKTATGMGPSDHQSFYLKKLPVLFLFTGLHADYHRPSDTWDKVNLAGMQKVVGLSDEIIRELSVMEPRPEYVQVAGPPMNPRGDRPRARLGIMPDYSDGDEGVTISGVLPDGPAAKAGLKDNDRIVEIAGQPVKNMTSYMAELRKAEPGKELEITVKRKNETLKVKIKPAG